MKSKVFTVLALLIILMGLTACGEKADAHQAPL